MASLIRYLLTVAVATTITLSAFYLMHRLIDLESTGSVQPPPVARIHFGPVDIPEPPRETVRKPPEKPEPNEPPPSKNVMAEVRPIERPLDFEHSSRPAGVAVPLYEASFARSSRASDGDASPVAPVAPPYPRDAALEGIEGWVRVSVEIDENGRVGEVSVIESRPRGVFDDAAVRAVRRWSWRPAIVDGEARAQRVVQELTFSLSDG
jgi:protein TonB